MLILDAATSYLTAYPCLSSSATEVIQKLHEWMDTYQATPKAICGDMAFHSPHDLKEFYRYHNIRPLPTGPHTPWPNRAETAVRLFKGFLKAMVERLGKEESLKNVTAAQLMRKAATIRNTQITFSGKTPLELTFGRRPKDLLDPTSMDPQQLTTEPNKEDRTNEELQRLAMKTHLEVQQREDIRRDLASHLKFVPPNLVPGDRVYFWQTDSSKIKQGKKSGNWVKATIVAVQGPMATINNGTSILQVNVSKLRRPLEEISVEGVEDSRERSPGTALYQSTREGTVDIAEFFSETSLLSVACATRGLRTSPPVDLRRKVAIQKGALHAEKLLTVQKPMVVILEPSSLPWTWMKSKWKKWQMQEWAYPLAQLCVEIADWQIKEGRYFIIKQPAESTLWNLNQ